MAHAESTWLPGSGPRWFTRSKMVTHPGTNRVRRRVTTFIVSNALPLRNTGTGFAWCRRCRAKKRTALQHIPEMMKNGGSKISKFCCTNWTDKSRRRDEHRLSGGPAAGHQHVHGHTPTLISVTSQTGHVTTTSSSTLPPPALCQFFVRVRNSGVRYSHSSPFHCLSETFETDCNKLVIV